MRTFFLADVFPGGRFSWRIDGPRSLPARRGLPGGRSGGDGESPFAWRRQFSVTDHLSSRLGQLALGSFDIVEPEGPELLHFASEVRGLPRGQLSQDPLDEVVAGPGQCQQGRVRIRGVQHLGQGLIVETQ